jgi:pimeloyl-ACP methyl ester carboxylesterase
MRSPRTRFRRLRLAVAFLAVIFATFTPLALAEVQVRFTRIDGFPSPGTPPELNKVGILQIGSPDARNVLVLNPGTSASAAYFAPLARTVVERLPAWQVWAVERRENLLEDHSFLDRAKAGLVTGQELFDYYLGWLTNPNVTTHFQLIPDAAVGFARGWGMRVEIEDLHRVVAEAGQSGRRVVLGGHSLGGSITAAYATWDFAGKPGAKDLRGLVFIDGGSGPVPITPQQAIASLQALASGSPWLSFGGIVAPFAGLFNATGSLGALLDPDAPSIGQAWPLLPMNLKPPVPVTNLGQYGYALDVKTSPPSLIAAQAHLGQLDETGNPPFGWDSTGALTPIQRYADMFSGLGLSEDGIFGLDGTAWYHPQRLTLDSGAVAAGNPNPAQAILDVRAIHGHDLSKHLLIYAFGAALGGQRVLDAATILAQQSGIPRENLTLVDRHDTYAHNDPNSAFPENAFIDHLVPFLAEIDRP